MKIRKIAADLTFTNLPTEREDRVIIIDGNGTILAIEDVNNHDPSSLQRLNGALVPGYVNAHCHLELSHMLGRIDSGTGLLSFIKSVVTNREVDPKLVAKAIKDADQEMYNNGIVAVGDISNTVDTFTCKEESPLTYYTFVEMFDLMNRDITPKAFEQYKDVYQQAPEDECNFRSAVPHAPYSVSPELFQSINNLNTDPSTISVHTLETPAEIELFDNRKGGFPPLFRSLGVEMTARFPTDTTPMQYLLSHLDSTHRTLFVHNTLACQSDIRSASEWNDQVYWASCPNANLYIENRLPDYQMFIEQGAKVCLGTDSLSSNWQLSIFEEMRTIAKYQASVPFEELVKWSSYHGAQALGLEGKFGTLEVGKKPGLNLITLNARGHIDQQSESMRII